VTLVLWASAFVAIRHLGQDFEPGSLSLGRLVVGAIALGVVAVPQIKALPRPTGREWGSIIAIGVLWFGIYNVSLNEGEHHVDAGTASMLLQVSPILIAVLATVFLHERFTTYLAIGLALAFSGVALIGTADSDGGSRDLLGVLLCVVSAAVYSISAILQKPLVARLPALHITWLACTVGAVVCLPFAGQLVDDTSDAPLSSILWVVYLGVFPTAIAFTTYAYALRHMSASSLGVTTYLVPPITIVMGLVFLSEAPPTIAYVGGVLALLGVAVARRVSTRPSSLGSAPPPAAEAPVVPDDDSTTAPTR
jgi:drug/metabolite transporter (DMT)-like permease